MCFPATSIRAVRVATHTVYARPFHAPNVLVPSQPVLKLLAAAAPPRSARRCSSLSRKEGPALRGDITPLAEFTLICGCGCAHARLRRPDGTGPSETRDAGDLAEEAATGYSIMSTTYNLVVDKVVLFGDSITNRMSEADEGFNFYGSLQHWFSRRLDVVSRGFGGYNSDHGLHILPRLLAAETAGGAQIRLITIFFGTNDSANNWQHVPLERYASNLRAMVDLVKERCPGTGVILMGPGPHDDANYEDRVEDPRSNARNLQYSRTAKQVAQEYNLPFVDLYSTLVGDADPAQDPALLPPLLPDTIHYSPAAYKLFYENLVSTIETAFPHLVPDRLPLLLPHNSELEAKGNSLSLLDE